MLMFSKPLSRDSLYVLDIAVDHRDANDVSMTG